LKSCVVCLLFSILICGCRYSEKTSETTALTTKAGSNQSITLISSTLWLEEKSTPTWLPTGTSSPSSTPTQTTSPKPTITSTPTETLTPTVLSGNVYLGQMNHQWQTLNNCHRASIATLMGYYDIFFTQHEIDIAMDNLAEFVSDFGLTARVYTVLYSEVKPSDAVRWLLAEEIPVIAGQDLSTNDNTWHYRVIHGYDDTDRSFYVDDPALGNLRMPYDTFDILSRGEGQIIPVYPIEMDGLVTNTMNEWKMKLIQYPG